MSNLVNINLQQFPSFLGRLKREEIPVMFSETVMPRVSCDHNKLHHNPFVCHCLPLRPPGDPLIHPQKACGLY